MVEVLTAEQLQHLKEHKYNAEGTSILEPPFQVFWKALVEHIPMWWAPNALTLVGLLCNILSCLVLVWYCPTCTESTPPWALVLCALGLFLYQTLDAMDGKQARRTKSNSPLGELFDHGCDSVSCAFVMASVVITLQVGGDSVNWCLFSYFSSMFTFYVAHWQTYVLGKMKFNRLDVTEAQLVFISCFLASAIFSQSIWTVEVLSFRLNVLVIFFGQGCALLALWDFFKTLMIGAGCGKNGSTVANTSILTPIIPIANVIGLALLAAYLTKEDVVRKHTCLFLFAFGIVGAKVTNRLVVAHMTKSPLPFFDSTLIGPTILVVLQLVDLVSIPENWLLWLSVILGSIDLLKYSVNVVNQISDYLGIAVFRVSTVPSSSRSVRQANKRH